MSGTFPASLSTTQARRGFRLAADRSPRGLAHAPACASDKHSGVSRRAHSGA